MKKLLLLVSIIILFTGCSKVVVPECTARMAACRAVCEDNCGNCEKKSRATTRLNYTKYIHERHIEGVMPARFEASFRDPLQCKKTTCNCSADYDVCMQSKTTGIIKKRLQVPPACS